MIHGHDIDITQHTNFDDAFNVLLVASCPLYMAPYCTINQSTNTRIKNDRHTNGRSLNALHICKVS